MVVLNLVLGWVVAMTPLSLVVMMSLVGGMNSSRSLMSVLMASVASVLAVMNLSGLMVSGVWTMGYGVIMMLSVMMWMGGVFGVMWEVGMSAYLAHFSIAGVGGMLGCFLPLAELVSVLVRPITLGVRLATNISSGHVLVLMMGSALGAVIQAPILLPLWVAVVVLEVFVCILQGIIYSVLVSIYME